MSITYRELTSSEAERISELTFYDESKRFWRKVNGVKQWVEFYWLDEDFPDGYENHLAALKNTFEKDGYVLGAFDMDLLIGFCSINRKIFGEEYKYVLLDQIFLSTEYQRKGIGKKLFFKCAEKAKTWGADKFYICSSSTEETIAFYVALGCENAKEINEELDADDENDIQLEFDFSTMKLPIKATRLYITKFYETMAQQLHLNSLDEDNKRFVPDEVFETVDDAKKVIESIVSFYSSQEAPQIFAVHLKDGLLIGHVQAIPLEDGSWEVGYHIAKPFAGNGFATEALKAFLPPIMEYLEIDEIYGITHLENLASREVLKKCGFTIESEDENICCYIFQNKTI